jgi:hypothetical protein
MSPRSPGRLRRIAKLSILLAASAGVMLGQVPAPTLGGSVLTLAPFTYGAASTSLPLPAMPNLSGGTVNITSGGAGAATIYLSPAKGYEVFPATGSTSSLSVVGEVTLISTTDPLASPLYNCSWSAGSWTACGPVPPPTLAGPVLSLAQFFYTDGPGAYTLPAPSPVLWNASVNISNDSTGAVTIYLSPGLGYEILPEPGPATSLSVTGAVTLLTTHDLLSSALYTCSWSAGRWTACGPVPVMWRPSPFQNSGGLSGGITGLAGYSPTTGEGTGLSAAVTAPNTPIRAEEKTLSAATATVSGPADAGAQTGMAVSVTQAPYNAATDGTTDATAAIASACAAAKTAKVPLYFPPGVYLTDTITCVTDVGQTISGAGPGSAVLKSRSGGNVFETTAASIHAVTIQNIGIDGNGGASNHGIYFHADNFTFNVTIRNVIVRNLGGRCVYMPDGFDITVDGLECSSSADNGIELSGGPASIIENSYVHTVGANKAGYRIYSGGATILNCNGLDTPGTGGNATWARLGQNTADGDPTNTYAWVNIIGSNVEDFTKFGIWASNGTASFYGVSFLAYAGTTTEAIHFDGPFVSAVSNIDSNTNISTLGSWTAGYAIHAGNQCPGVLNSSFNGAKSTAMTCYDDTAGIAYPTLTLSRSNPAYGISALDISNLSSPNAYLAKLNNITFTKPASSATFTIADGKTFGVSNSLSLAGVDGTRMTFPGTSATLARTDAGNIFSGHQTIEGVTSAGATGTGNFVFATNPVINGLSFPKAAGAAVVTQTVASGTAAMGTSAISAGSCAKVVTSTANGAATTDVVLFGFNGDPTTVNGYGPSSRGQELKIYPYPASNTANFKVCNLTSSSITPGALTLNWRVVR